MARVSTEVTTLARAIVHAADLGARVIDVGSATCLPSTAPSTRPPSAPPCATRRWTRTR